MGKAAPSDDGKNVGLVIAHPDDEAMFFTPLLEMLRRTSPVVLPHCGADADDNGDTDWPHTEGGVVVDAKRKASSVYVLCLCRGEFDGDGPTRQAELLRSCRHYEISEDRVDILCSADFQDGWHYWDAQRVASAIQNFVGARLITTLFTFDSYGVSGHPNHISCFEGATRYCHPPVGTHMRRQTWRSSEEPRGHSSSSDRSVLQSTQLPAPNVYILKSPNIIRKYLGLVELILHCLWYIVIHITGIPRILPLKTVYASNIWQMNERSTRRLPVAGEYGESFTVVQTSPCAALRGLLCHKSQLRWFRAVFVVLSRVSYFNTFVNINGKAKG